MKRIAILLYLASTAAAGTVFDFTWRSPGGVEQTFVADVNAPQQFDGPGSWYQMFGTSELVYEPDSFLLWTSDATYSFLLSSALEVSADQSSQFPITGKEFTPDGAFGVTGYVEVIDAGVSSTVEKRTPEPGTFFMMIGGIGLILTVLHRRRVKR